jgi:SSS family solute:Na+ symporter
MEINYLTISILAIYCAIIFALGAYGYKVSQNTVEDYFLMGRSMGWIVGFLSIMSNLLSAFTFFGLAGIATFGAGCAGWFIAGEACLGTMYAVFAPRLWRLSALYNYVTPTDLIADRFEFNDSYGKSLRQILAWTYITIGLIPSVIVQVQALGFSMEILTGVPYVVGGLILTVVMTLYVILGGMRSVSWVGAFQGGVMLVMIWVGALWIASKVGGIPQIWQTLIAEDPGYVGVNQGYYEAGRWLSIFPFFIWASIMKPASMQAIFSTKDEKTLARISWLFPLATVIMVIPATVMIGPMAKVLLPEITNPDYVFAELVVQYLPIAFSGLLLAAAIAAIMSTADSEVLGASVIFVKDIYGSFRPNATERQTVYIGRIVIVIIMAVSFIIAAKAPRLIFELESMLGLALLQTLPVFFGGLFWRRMTKQAALAGCAIGIPLSVFASFKFGATELYPPFNLIPGIYVFILTCIIVVVVSLLTKPPSQEVQRKFFDVFEPAPELKEQSLGTIHAN